MEKHGMRPMGKPIPEYNTWRCIKSRCYNKNDKDYAKYGARNVTVAKEWQKSFVAFLNYVGTKPSPNHSLDRIDTNGNYEPGNVRWADIKTQNRNRRGHSNAISRYKGVGKSESLKNPWKARIRVNNLYIHIGQFATEEAAALAYNKAAIKYFGKAAYLNKL